MIVVPTPTPRSARQEIPQTATGVPGWSIAVLALAVLVVLASVLGPAVPAVGQGAPAVPARTASVPIDPDAPPATQVGAFWMESSSIGADEAQVTVVFATAFAVPDDPWRVSVSVGDPLGQRVRTSLVTVGQTVSGLVERGDGTLWQDEGDAEVGAPGDGRVNLVVPVGGAPEGAVVWVEAEATADGEIVTSSSSWFALDDLLGTRAGPALGTAPVAEVVDDAEAGPVAVPGTGPTVQVVGRALEVTTTEPVAVEVDGTEVQGVVDTVEVAQDVGLGPRIDRLEIDRGTGEVRLVPDGGEPEVAEAGVTPWLVNPPSPTAPGGPVTVTVDLDALDQALDGPVFDRATTRVGVHRDIELVDGRVLQADGVLGTMAWFDEALVATSTADDLAAADAPVADSSDASPLLLVGVGVVVLLLVVAVVVLVLRARRRRQAAGGPPTTPSAPADDQAGPASIPPAPVSDAPAPVSDAPAPVPEAAAPASASDPLAALLAEVEELSARVDRLGGDETPR